MKEEDKELDQLFRKRLQDTEKISTYNEEDWMALEVRLDKADQKKAVFYWARIGSGIAAILVLAFGWWFFDANTTVDHFSKAKKTRSIVSKPIIQLSPKLETLQGNLVKPLEERSSFDNLLLSKNQAHAKESVQHFDDRSKLIKDSLFRTETIAVLANVVEKTAVHTDRQQPNDTSATSSVIAVDLHSDGALLVLSPVDTKEKLKKDKKINRVLWAVSVVASSDLNGSSFLGENKVGNSLGALFSVQVSKKITIQTGLTYSNKPYKGNSDSYLPTYGSNPYAAKYKPTSVDVVCEMLDLPLNLDYQFFENKVNKLSVGTGLSSYVMLHENYQYNFDPASAYASKNYKVPNSKTYLFSILNLNVTYERSFNKRIGLVVQPYFKLPLQEVGYGHVKLHSAGLAVGLKLNLNKHKPGF